jgi:type II secretory pathway component GspD/PulD (secretin)
MNQTMRILAALGILALPGLAQESIDERKEAIVNKLNSMRIDVDFRDVTLEEALNFIRDFSGLNIVVSAEVLAKTPVEELKITLKVKDLLLKSVMKLMLASRNLTATYREGVILVVPKEEVDRNVVLDIYDVRDLLFKLQDFPGPRVELVSPSAAGAGGPLTGATFSLEEPRSTITEDFITEMVKSNTGDRTWDENPNASITLANGMLVVSQSKRVHAEVKHLINMLRQFK